MEKKKSNEELIKDLTQKIVANSKDMVWAKDMVANLILLQKQSDNMNKLMDVSLNDVSDYIDFGPCEFHKVTDGYVFVAKGGLTTHVSLRMQSVWAMCNTLFELHTKKDKSKEEQELYDSFSDAIMYCFQTPIFASMDEMSLFSIATNILQVFDKYCKENIDNAEVREDTEADVKANIISENMAKVIDDIASDEIDNE